MKRGKRTGLLFMAVVMLFGAFPVRAQAAVSAPEGMTKVAENEYLTLFLDEEETGLAVVDNATGKTWYTNPPGADEDGFATPYYKRLMKCQLQIQYFNENVQSSLIDNYNDSIANEQFEIELLEDGVTITYTIGAAKGTLLLPESLSEERYDYYFNLMDSDAQKRINRNYVYVDLADSGKEDVAAYIETYPGYTTNFYVLRAGVRDYLREEMAEYFKAVGYTHEDLEADMIASGVGDAESDDPWFIVPLTYRLEGNQLVVTLDPATVEYNDEGYYPVHIDVLPYFGATNAQEGYLFVPDGSGALIYLNNGKTAFSSYSALVYGQDETKLVLSSTKSEIDPRLTVKMPVFGVKSEDQAMFAIIEDGSGYANVAADVSGRTTSYNNVYSGFNFLQYGPAALSSMVGASNSYQLYSEPVFAGAYQIRYSFLTGKDADYSGMAACYRDYLEQRGVLSRNTEGGKLPLYTEYIGAINKYKTILGVKYDAIEPLTTFAQGEQIAEELKSLGVNSQKIIYSGWANGGLHNTADMKLKVVSSLQRGGVSAKEFQADMAELGIDTYMTIDMQYVYKDKLMDGYSTLQYAPGYFDHTNITVKSYFTSDGNVEKKLADLVSPYFANRIADRIGDGMNKYRITGLNLGSVSNYLYSDFLENHYTDRQMAIGLYESSFQTLSEKAERMLGDNGNDYTWKYTDEMINVPLSSNGYQILDEDVPFYEMVLHGYIQYAGEAINMADDYRTTFLKSVESGAGLYYQWIYGDNSLLKETDFDYLYSVHYGNWIGLAAQDYQAISSALDGLGNQVIVKHERTGDVTKTTYGNGTVVIVNYGKEEAQCDGVTVGARDFAVLKGSD